MQIVFMDLGLTECGENFALNRLSIKYGNEWSPENLYSFDFSYGCDKGDFSLFQSKSDLINYMIGEREKFQELFPNHYEDYLNTIEYLKMFKH